MNRQEYLRQMYLKNRGLLKDNTVSDLAYLDTAQDSKNATYTVNNLNTDQETDAQSATAIDKGDWWQRTLGTLNQLGSNLVGGAIDSFEGVGDFFVNTAGWIGSLFGADDQWAKDFTSYDWSSDVTNFLAKANDTIAPWNWGRINDIWNDENYLDTINQQSWFSENDTVNSWVNNIESMVGNMLPSIALTYATGGAYAASQAGAVANGFKTASQVANTANNIGKWAGLLEMSVSAAGSSSTEALNEGAELPNALLYGILSGGVELGTELIGGEGVAGVLTKPLSDNLAKNLVKAFVSEGAEEVLGDLVSPLIDLTYKNNDSWESAINYLNEEYTSQEFAKGLLDSFIMGGIGGLIFGGASEIGNYRKYGKTGYSYVSTVNEVNEVKEKLDKARTRGNETQIAKLETRLTELGNKLSDLATKIGGNSELQRKLAEQVGDYVELDQIENKLNKEFSKIEVGESTNTIEQAINNATNEYNEAFNKITKRITEVNDQVIESINDFTQKIKSKYGIDVEVELQDNFESKTGRSAQYQNGKIVIDSKYKSNVYPLLSHEVGHAFSENLDTSSSNEIYERMVRTGVAKQFEEEIKDTDNYKNAKTPEAKRNILVKESISYYLESIVESESNAKETFLETSLIKKVFEPRYYKNLEVNNEIRKQLGQLARSSKYAQRVVNKYFKGEGIFARIGLISTNDLLKEVEKKYPNITEVELNILKSFLESGNATGIKENSNTNLAYAKEKSKKAEDVETENQSVENADETETNNWSVKDRESVESLLNGKFDDYDLDSDVADIISDSLNDSLDEFFENLQEFKTENHTIEEAQDFIEDELDSLSEQLKDDVRDQTEDFEEKPKGYKNAINGLIKVLKKNLLVEEVEEKKTKSKTKKVKETTTKKIAEKPVVKEEAPSKKVVKETTVKKVVETEVKKESVKEEKPKTKYSSSDFISEEYNNVFKDLKTIRENQNFEEDAVKTVSKEKINKALETLDSKGVEELKKSISSEIDKLTKDKINIESKDLKTTTDEGKIKKYDGQIAVLNEIIKNIENYNKPVETKVEETKTEEKKTEAKKKTKTEVKAEEKAEVEETEKVKKKTGINFKKIENAGKDVNTNAGINKNFHYNKTTQTFAKMGINFDGYVYDIMPEDTINKFIKKYNLNDEQVKKFKGALHGAIQSIQKMFKTNIDKVGDSVESNTALYKLLNEGYSEKVANATINRKTPLPKEISEPIIELLEKVKGLIFAPHHILFDEAVKAVETETTTTTSKTTVETKTAPKQAKTSTTAETKESKKGTKKVETKETKKETKAVKEDSSLKKDVKELKKDVKELKDQSLNIEERETLKGELADMRKEKSALKSDNKKLKEKSSDLKRQSNTNQRQKNRTENKLADSTAQLESVNKELNQAKEDLKNTKEEKKHVIDESVRAGKSAYQMEVDKKILQGKKANSVDTGKRIAGTGEPIYRSKDTKADVRYAQNFSNTYETRIQGIEEFRGNEFKNSVSGAKKLSDVINQLHERIIQNPEVWDDGVRYDNFYSYFGDVNTLYDFLKMIDKHSELIKEYNTKVDSSEVKNKDRLYLNDWFEINGTHDKIVELIDNYAKYRKANYSGETMRYRFYDPSQSYSSIDSEIGSYETNYVYSIQNNLTPAEKQRFSVSSVAINTEVENEMSNMSSEMYKLKNGVNNENMPLQRLDPNIKTNQILGTGVSTEALMKLYKIIVNYATLEQGNMTLEEFRDLKKDLLTQIRRNLVDSGALADVEKNGTKIVSPISKLINKIHNINYQTLKKNGSRELLIQLERAKYVVDKILSLEGTGKDGKVVQDVNAYIIDNYPKGTFGIKITSPLQKVEFKKLSTEMSKLIKNLRIEFGFEKGYTFNSIEFADEPISMKKYKFSKDLLKESFSFFPQTAEEAKVRENTFMELSDDQKGLIVPTQEYEFTSLDESKKEYVEEFLKQESKKVGDTPNSVQSQEVKDASKKVMTENVDRTKTHETLTQFTERLRKAGKSKGYIHDVISWLANHPMWLRFQKQRVNSQVYFERAVEKFGFNKTQSAEMTYRLRTSDKVASYLVENGFEIVDGVDENGKAITHKASIYHAYSSLVKSVMEDTSLSSQQKTELLKKLKNKADLYMYNLYQMDNNEAPKKKVDYLLQQSNGDLFLLLSEYDIDPQSYFKNTKKLIGERDQVYPENLKKAIDVDVRQLQELIEERGKAKGFTEAKQVKAKKKLYDILESVKKGAEIKTVFGKIVDSKAIKGVNLEVLREFSPELVERIETSLENNGFVWNEDLGNYAPIDFGENETAKEEYSKLKKLTRDFTNEELQKVNDEILKEFPQVKEYQKELRETLDAMLGYRVKKGLVDSNLADNLQELYPNYVPTYREQISYTGSEKTLKGVNATNDVRERKGSAQLISPLLQSMTNQTRSMVKKGTINDIANQIDTMADITKTRDVESDIVLDTENRTIPKIYSIEELLEQIDNITPAEEENNNVTYYKKVNGELVEKRMTLTNDAMQAFQQIESENKFDDFIFAKALKKGMNLFTNLVTSYNPFFLIRNATRDFGDAILTTQNNTTEFIKEYGKSYYEIVNNSEMYQLYRSLGGGVFDSYAGDSLTTLEEKYTNENSKLRKAKNMLGIANEVVEAAPRFTEFKLSYQKYIDSGMTATEAGNLAMLDAARVTTDFSRGGTWGKSLNRVLIPFLNAQIQGASKVVNFTKNTWLTFTHPKDKKEILTLLAKMLLLGVAPELLSWLINIGNEDYEALPEYTKAQYLCIPLWNGNFIKIPKGRIIGTLNNTVYQAMEIAKGNKSITEGAKDWLDVASTNLAPVDLGSGIRTIFSPISDVQNNTTWYGQSIDNTSDLNKYGKQRYDSSTSEIAKAIGNIFNYSPKRIDYLLDSYTGVVGDVLLPLTVKSNYSDVGGTLMSFVNSNITVSAVKNNRYRGESYEMLQNLLYEKNAGSEVGAVQYNYLKRALDECKDLEEVVNQAKTKAEQYTAYLTLREAYKQAITNTELIAQKLDGVSGIDTSDRYVMTELYHQMFGAEYALKYYNSTLGEKVSIARSLGISAESLYTAYFETRGVSTTTEAKVIVNSLAKSYYGRLWLKKAVGLSLTSAESTKLERYLKAKGLSS